jgi:hypothetical protein
VFRKERGSSKPLKIFMQHQIPVYIINLKERQERLAHIKSQFRGRKEFDTNVVEAVRHPIGSLGLWQTIVSIIKNISDEYDYIILCEDDHQFTEIYSKEILFSSIDDAKKLDADLLLGGPSWVNNLIPVNENICWAEKFTGLQFTIVFRKLFAAVLEADFSDSDCADEKIGALTKNKYFIHPSVSVQKDFGYSDATLQNNDPGRLTGLFENYNEKVTLIKSIGRFYANLPVGVIDKNDLANISIPTYIINLAERNERRRHILNEFEGRTEFDVTVVPACAHKIGAVGLWQSIRRVIKLALENEDDVILICEDDHEFTNDYSKEYLMSNILEAHHQGIDFLSGGCGGFGLVLPIAQNRFWASSLLSTQFIVIYRRFFQKILDEFFDDDVKADIKLSEMTPNKMVLYPFVSLQKDFGYSDITPVHNEVRGLISELFEKSKNRLQNIQKAYLGLS